MRLCPSVLHSVLECERSGNEMLVELADLNRIYDGVKAEARKSQASFQIYLVSCEALPHTPSFCLYFHSKK